MSSKRLGNIPFASILPDAIRDDVQLRAAADALDGLLHRTTMAIPNLLLWARLDREKAVCIPPLQRLVDAAGGLVPLSSELLELLAWQFHVDFREVATNDAMLERMVRESIPWHRIKGTPAAVEQALAMYNVQALVDESGTGTNWAVYELELSQVPRGGTLANIVRVAGEAAPARCWLRRVYGGFDRRPIMLDRGPALDHGYLDDDSGVWDPATGVKESFGERIGLSAECAVTFSACIGAEALHSSRALYIDKPILDHWRLDNPTVKCHGIIGGALISLMSMGIWGEKYRWEGEWSHRRWTGSEFPVPYPMPRRRVDTHRSLSKSQMVLDFARLDSSLERLDRQRVVVVDNPHRLDFARMDHGSAELQRRVLFVDERFHNTSGSHVPFSPQGTEVGALHVRAACAERAQTNSGVGVTTFKEEVTGLLSLRRPYSLPDGTEWTGPWSHRTWHSMGVLIKSSTEGE